jgi:dTDP-4-amino-4,6-dideoxygalactose transaminase
VRLRGLAEATAARRELALMYRRRLGAGVTPVAERDAGHVYHLFPVRSGERDALMSFLAGRGIDTLVHYPVPLSSQPAFAGYDPHPCPVAGHAAAELLSLPLNPRLSREDVTRVADTVNEFSERMR